MSRTTAPRRRPEDDGWDAEELRSAYAADGSGPYRYAPDGSGPYSYDADGSGPWAVDAPRLRPGRRRRLLGRIIGGAVALAVVSGGVGVIDGVHGSSPVAAHVATVHSAQVDRD